MRRIRAYAVALVLLLLALLFNLYAWAGLALTPEVGPTVVDAAARESILASIYIDAGRPLAGLLGEDGARDFAYGRFGDLYRDVQARPATAMDTLTGGMSLTARISYYAPLWLPLLALILWWRRTRGIETYARKR